MMYALDERRNMFRGSCAILIPIYCEKLNLIEKLTVSKNILTLNQWDIFFVAPNSLDLSWYKKKFPSIKINRYSDEFFKSLSAYNKLMLTPEFYYTWRNYEYVLICQTDAIVLSDQLDRFCDLSFDYWGAPLFRLEDGAVCIYGGNGGFSLRNPAACYYMLKEYAQEVNTYIHDAEDVFFSNCGEKYPTEFRVAPPKLAMQFAFDQFARFLFYENNKQIPFAIHGCFTYDYEFTKTLLPEWNVSDADISYLKKRSTAENQIDDFCKNYKYIILYGAGQWGVVFARYLQIKNIEVEKFVISDNQVITKDSCTGIAVCHRSDLLNNLSDYGVIMTLSKRSLGDESYSVLCESLNADGIGGILETNLVMYNAAVETWLMIYERGSLQ